MNAGEPTPMALARSADPGGERSAMEIPRAGRRLGRYLLLDVLGYGAMATVFRGRDEVLGREVAVKVLNVAIAARDRAAERFAREARAVAALKHPGILEIHDFVPATAGEPSHLVTELVRGPTLREFVSTNGGKLLPEAAALLLAPVADALAVAHASGVVHRDIKPENIMLEAIDGRARVVLADFGIAHMSGVETMTSTGALMGSPSYMAPEQARGRKTGAPADVWAFGVVLYQTATGHLPFAGSDPLSVLAAVAQGHFRRPSHMNARVGTALESVIMRCLQVEPAARPTDLARVARDLIASADEGGAVDAALADTGLLANPLVPQVAERALFHLLRDPAGFEAELKPRIADAVVERARTHARRGEIARALGELGRATAYIPNHRGADALLQSLSVRRRWQRGLALMGGVVAAVLLALGLGGPRIRQVLNPPAIPAAHAQNRTARIAQQEITVVPLPLLTSAGTPGKVTPVKFPRTRRRLIARAGRRLATPPAPIATAAAVAELPPAPLAPVPAPGNVQLQSSRGFCYPTLDDQPVTASTLRLFANLSPGVHRVYCALQVDAPRLFVGPIEVLSGHTVIKNIGRNAHGEPALAGDRR